MQLLLLLVAASASSPVQKVIELLDDLKGKVEADLAKEQTLMDEYSTWCDEEANDKEDAITSAKRTIGDRKATIADAKATIMELTSETETLTMKISTAEADLKKATSIRTAEQKTFSAAEKELLDTVDSLSRASSVLKKNLGFLQTGRAAQEMSLMAGGLQRIVEASWANAEQKAVLRSLLQTKDSDEDLELQPQATSAAYESKSGGILDTIADMQEKAEESLSSTRADEMNAQHSFQMVKQGLEDETSVMKKRLSEATQTRSSTEQELHGAEEELAQTKKTLGADETYLAELKQSCKSKASEWAVRQKSAGEETAAIEKAKGILSEGVKVLLQTSTTRTTTKVLSEDDAARSKVLKIFSQLASKFGSFSFQQLRQRARSDPFGKIRGLVETMITRLEKEAAEEATQKAFCDEETGESKAKQADLTGKLDKTTARMEKAEADKVLLNENIGALQKELSEMASGQAEATKVRQEEHAEFLTSSADFKASAEAVAKATSVLSDYYGSASLLQIESNAPEFGGAKSDVGSTIVSILEVAESDFTTLLAEAEAAESEASSVFDKLVQGNAVAKATKEGDVKGKQAEVSQLEVAIGNYQEDRATTSSELDAVLTYLEKLKPQCETKVVSYAEKKARREQEIDGLKEALLILAPEGFLQVSLVPARRV